jgi:protein TonB
MPALPTGGGNVGIVEAIRRSVSASDCSGRVGVHFVVQADGQVAQVRIEQPLNSLCDAAVLAAVQQLPRFRPGWQNGVDVPVSYSLPILLPGPVRKP